ncbi:MAG: hypothetical protein AAFQ53_14830 [Bacteroidota bacterium]
MADLSIYSTPAQYAQTVRTMAGIVMGAAIDDRPEDPHRAARDAVERIVVSAAATWEGGPAVPCMILAHSDHRDAWLDDSDIELANAAGLNWSDLAERAFAADIMALVAPELPVAS